MFLETILVIHLFPEARLCSLLKMELPARKTEEVRVEVDVQRRLLGCRQMILCGAP